MSKIDLIGRDLLCTHWVIRGSRKLDGVSRVLSGVTNIRKVVVDSDDTRKILSARCNCGELDTYSGVKAGEELPGTVFVLRAMNDEHVRQLLNDIPTGCGCYILIEYETKTLFPDTLHFMNGELIGCSRRLEEAV